MLPKDVHVGVEGIVLEHHGHVPVLGGDVVDDAVSDADRARCDFLQPGHHAQNGGFSAAGGAHQNHEFLVCDIQADAVNHFRFAEFLDDIADRDLCHGFPVVNCELLS
jgi:hypothetical protein